MRNNTFRQSLPSIVAGHPYLLRILGRFAVATTPLAAGEHSARRSFMSIPVMTLPQPDIVPNRPIPEPEQAILVDAFQRVDFPALHRARPQRQKCWISSVFFPGLWPFLTMLQIAVGPNISMSPTLSTQNIVPAPPFIVSER